MTDSDCPICDLVELALVKPAPTPSAKDRAAIRWHYVATHPDVAAKIRLGATQDLAWALANSPAFLFNR